MTSEAQRRPCHVAETKVPAVLSCAAYGLGAKMRRVRIGAPRASKGRVSDDASVLMETEGAAAAQECHVVWVLRWRAEQAQAPGRL